MRQGIGLRIGKTAGFGHRDMLPAVVFGMKDLADTQNRDLADQRRHRGLEADGVGEFTAHPRKLRGMPLNQMQVEWLTATRTDAVEHLRQRGIAGVLRHRWQSRDRGVRSRRTERQENTGEHHDERCFCCLHCILPPLSGPLAARHFAPCRAGNAASAVSCRTQERAYLPRLKNRSLSSLLAVSRLDLMSFCLAIMVLIAGRAESSS